MIIEMITSREIIIYDDDQTRCQLKKIIDQFFILWIDYNQFIDILKKKWMFINLTFDVKMQIVKFYSLSKRDQKFVDKKFDKLYSQNKINWIIKITFHE